MATLLIIFLVAIPILSIGFAVTVGWSKFHIDNHRQKIFALRDRMFDDAASGELKFDDEIYARLRHLMNMQLQYADRVSWLWVFLYNLEMQRSGLVYDEELYAESWNRVFRNARGNVTTYQRYKSELDFLIMEHVVLSSRILNVIYRLLLTQSILKDKATKLAWHLESTGSVDSAVFNSTAQPA